MRVNLTKPVNLTKRTKRAGVSLIKPTISYVK
ncbi:hypothetical protein SEA_SEPHIROTH_132 [Gordonia Phage Sephiroth]|uniref:Uncharacterized protein n=2 Tax=Octobienvirus TaxID=3044779 RepID=A0AAE8Y7K0_9CAUD|nr:hypothetical protein L3Y23_gp099 [Gordonia Phage Sephiroth]YP_010246652.1 hypothetical protein L3Y24_gp104 [Gordonia phage Kudefre]QNN99466.1 hypothetical protein SEA_SEPHIROTH_132 [Gordonia Phage Sephiroth]UDL15373.1 hypothetical protein SEA_KUDEFRE_139 [Gordonia phage Kudefre]